MKNTTQPPLKRKLVRPTAKATGGKSIQIKCFLFCCFRTVINKSSVKIDTVLTYCRGCMNDNSLQDYIPFFKVCLSLFKSSIMSMPSEALCFPGGTRSQFINPFMPNGYPHCYQLDQSISVLSVVGW